MTEANTTIRAATPDDLARIWDILYRNEVADEDDPPPQRAIPAHLHHVLATGRLLVSEADGQIAAFAGTIDRGGPVFLTDLFVDPDLQSGRHGKALLTAIFEDVPVTSRFTLSSVDHRAIALYARFGMTPRWPNLLLEAPVAELRIDPAWTQPAEAVACDDTRVLALDAEVCGRARTVDFAFWRDRQAGQAWWMRIGADHAGFAIIRPGGGTLWHPDAVAVGPCAGRTPDLARAVTLAAVARAAELGTFVEIAVPGPHPALRPLLDAGFKIVYVETACVADPTMIDPERMIGSGGDLF